jgi:hypothetical protein
MHLTKQTPEDHFPAGQASAEIDVTPEMAAAGARVLADHVNL